MRGGEADDRDEEEQRDQDRQLEPVDRGDRHHSPRVLMYTSPVNATLIGTHKSWYQ
jgi:hypothetical protein